MDDAGLIRARYRKLHLLPFGERIPFQKALPFLGKLDFGQAEWTPGPEQTIFEVDGHRFANLICFESIFSGLSRSAVMRGAGFLVNMTNDGWFGDTLLPHQHSWMAVMRAAENRVPLLRCANNGLSFLVLPSGRVTEMTRLFERSSFVGTIQPRPGGSFYTRHGDGAVFLLIAAGFVFVLLAGRRPRRAA
jgi:apolipoprotein N-acyltransferase